MTDDIVDANWDELALVDVMLVLDELEDWVPPDDIGTEETSLPV